MHIDAKWILPPPIEWMDRRHNHHYYEFRGCSIKSSRKRQNDEVGENLSDRSSSHKIIVILIDETYFTLNQRNNNHHPSPRPVEFNDDIDDVVCETRTDGEMDDDSDTFDDNEDEEVDLVGSESWVSSWMKTNMNETSIDPLWTTCRWISKRIERFDLICQRHMQPLYRIE